MPQAQHHLPPIAEATPQDAHGLGRVGLLEPDGDLFNASALLAEIDGLRQRLASQPLIEQAKGILMGHYGINNDTAFQLLRRWSQETNTKIRHIAELLTESAADGAGSRRAPHQVIEQELPGRQLSAR